MNAQHVKNVPGRKTDVRDARWLCQLLEHGLVRASFVPPKPIGELRGLTRYRKSLTWERQREANRLLINRRYTRSSMIVTSNKRVSEWARLFGDEVLAAAILDRLLHDAEVLTINGPSWRLRGRGDILEDRPDGAQKTASGTTDTPRRPRRRPQKGAQTAT